MYSEIKVIGFDADDTLWVNETYFREAEDKFARLLNHFETENNIAQELYRVEIENLNLYGYGVKSFMLSMIECALEISQYQLHPHILREVIEIGKVMLTRPLKLLDGVEDALAYLTSKYKLVLVTKGDLLDQENKLRKSGLEDKFHHIEIVSEKNTESYRRLIRHLDIDPKHFLMVGNSLKSDVLPLIEIGSKAIHIPFHTTWIHEQVTIEKDQNHLYTTLSSLEGLIGLL